MTITLYQKKELKGKSLGITRNYRDLGNSTLGRNPSSLDMSAPGDAVALFKKQDWDGGVMYYRGKRRMTSLGNLSQGGEFMSGNTVASVRVTPFTVKLNVTVVCKFLDFKTNTLRYPGGKTSEKEVETTIEKALILVNSFFDKEKALIRAETAEYSYLPNDAKFDLKPLEAGKFPPTWKERGQIDVIVVNTLKRAYGMAKPPWFGKVVIVELADRTISQVARTLAHEICHYLGLGHQSGGGAMPNIMSPSDLGEDIDKSVLTSGQIEELQQKLARHPTRQMDRHGD